MRDLIIAALVTASLGFAGCNGDDGGTTPDAGTNPDSGVEVACDPNQGPQHVRMLNAPLRRGAEVVKKAPRHPGRPGPEGLP